MEEKLYRLHLEAGRICGQERTCGSKRGFNTEAEADKAAQAHNAWKERKHDVEPYPCYFCAKWHIGGIMTEDRLLTILQSEVAGGKGSVVTEE
jgi:hypothetical protein